MADNDIQKAVVRHAQADMANLPPNVSATPAEPAKEAGRKIGEGHAMAMARLGGHELTQALNAFPDSNIKAMEEPGVFGNENAPQHKPIGQDQGGQEQGGYDPGEFARGGPANPPSRGRGR